MSGMDDEPHASLRELLAHYDGGVREAMGDVARTTTGTSRVQALHILSRVVSTHDSVVGSALCPLLHDLPGGPEVADRLRHGCEERALLLARFQSLTQGTEARNVYPVFGADVEMILSELGRSFEHHVEDETTRVGVLLESAASSVAPDVIAAKMAIEATRAPARAHPVIYRHRASKALRAVYRGIDRIHVWNDSHHGWPATRHEPSRPVRPRRDFTRHPPSIPDLLSGYDATTRQIIAELADTEVSDPRRPEVVYRLAAAIAIHDSVLGGTLCWLLEAVPEGREAGAILRKGCQERARLLEEWDELIKDRSPSDLLDRSSGEANRIVGELIASFGAHETQETEEVSAAIERMRRRPWKSGGTGLVSPYLLPDWPNPEPGVLAAHMALWAEKAPTHSHPLLTRHPTSRILRSFYRRADHLRDRRRSRQGWPALR